MKTKTKGKAIAGIAMAAIIAAVILASVPTVSAREADGNITSGDTIFLGEHGLHFNTTALPNVAFLKKFDDTTLLATIPIANSRDFTISIAEETGGYDIYNATHDIGDVTIKEPSITANVYIEATPPIESIVGKSIPVGQNITIRVSPNFGGLMNYTDGTAWSTVKIKLIDPDGLEIVHEVDADASEKDVAWAEWDVLNVTGWDTGTWKVQIVTNKTSCNEVDEKSPEYEFTVRSEELDITAAKDEVGKGEDIVLSVSGSPLSYYYLAIGGVKDDEEPEVIDTNDVKALGLGEGTAGSKTAAWIKTGSDGIADVKVSTSGADERTYTIYVYQTPVNSSGTLAELTGFDAPAGMLVATADEDDVKVKVVKAKVTFDIPTTVIIGEDVKIKGTISAGDKVDIIVKDQEVVGDDKAVDENNEFEEKWDTGGMTRGSYTIEVYIDDSTTTTDPDGYDDIDEDGKTTIRLVAPGLDAEQLRNVIAEGDDYEIEGTATGTDDVDYILIGPKGWKTGAGTAVTHGIRVSSTSVSDNEFIEEETMTAGLDTGMWIALVLSPGRDTVYATTGGESAGGLTIGSFAGLVVGKNQDQIVAMIKDQTSESVGSDDLLEAFTFKVESARVDLDPIASVAVGEPLVITGTTNREPETMMTISKFTGPGDLPAVIAEVEWPTASQGVFNATIDTTDAVVGTYTIEADDGDGNTDTVTVDILTAVPVTPTPVVEVTATPEVEVTPTIPVAEATATPEPTPTPTPTPGFEAVFAIAGLLAVAYLVQRKRRE